MLIGKSLEIKGRKGSLQIILMFNFTFESMKNEHLTRLSTGSVNAVQEKMG